MRGHGLVKRGHGLVTRVCDEGMKMSHAERRTRIQRSKRSSDRDILMDAGLKSRGLGFGVWGSRFGVCGHLHAVAAIDSIARVLVVLERYKCKRGGAA